MKRLFLTVISASLLLIIASCRKEKTYTCKCTYVYRTNILNPTPQPNIEETVGITNKSSFVATSLCQDNESKYWGQDYSGTCNLQ
ncbi:MAG: hypothetical protein KF900_05995 [Bacteroidetes bacterium]|nr:hypothetical protein [Bacteroidota bacterium]